MCWKSQNPVVLSWIQLLPQTSLYGISIISYNMRFPPLLRKALFCAFGACRGLVLFKDLCFYAEKQHFKHIFSIFFDFALKTTGFLMIFDFFAGPLVVFHMGSTFCYKNQWFFDDF